MRKLVLLLMIIMVIPNWAWAEELPVMAEPLNEPISVGPPGPTPPTGLITKNITQTSIDLSWHTNPAEEEVESYNIYKDGLLQTNTDQTKYTASNLEPGKTYKFYVTARNTNGEGPASNVISAATLSPYVPPKNLRATNIGSNTINITWDGQAPNYEVYVNGVVVDVTPYNSYSITDLEPETPYEIYVTGVYETGYSEPGKTELFETSGSETSEASNILTVESGATPIPASVEGIVGASFPYIRMLVPFLIMSFAIGATFLIIENLPVVLGRRRY